MDIWQIARDLEQCRSGHCKADPYLSMGLCKVILQTHGIDTSGVQLPINSDSAGLYCILRDELLKIEVPLYVHRSEQGYRINSTRSVIDVGGRPVILEFERPYLSLQSKVDGVPFRDICNIEYEGHLALTANHGCLYFKEGSACKFCAIPEWRDAEDRSIKHLIDASAYAIAMGEVRHLSITTGTAPGSDRGIKSILMVLSRLAEKTNLEAIPIFAEFEPPEDLEWLDRLRAAGVTTISCNLEFLTPSRRQRFMPGKGVIPFSSFLRVWEHGVAVFGRNQVFSNILMTADEFSSGDELACDELAQWSTSELFPRLDRCTQTQHPKCIKHVFQLLRSRSRFWKRLLSDFTFKIWTQDFLWRVAIGTVLTARSTNSMHHVL